MSQVPYTPEDIEAAHLLLQIYHSFMKNSNHTQSQNQSGQQIFAESHGEITVSAASNPVSMANSSTVVNAPAPVPCQESCTSCRSKETQFTSTTNTDQTSPQSTVVEIMRPHANERAHSLSSTQFHLSPSVAELMNYHPAQESASRPTAPMQPSQIPIPAVFAPQTNQDSTQTVQPEQGPATLNSNQALQAYLFRQQRIAGIAPQNFITMPEQGSAPSQTGGQGGSPSVIQVTRDGNVVVPNIPPARFDRVILHPLVTSTAQTPGVPVSVRPSDPVHYAVARSSKTVSEGLNGQNSHHESGNDSQDASTGNHNSIRPMPPAIQNLCQPTSENMSILDHSAGHDGDNVCHELTVQALTSSSNQPQSQNEAASRNKIHREFSPYFDIPGVLTGLPQLVQMVVEKLGVGDFANLYAASKRFHRFVKANPQCITTSVAFVHFPESALIWPYACYREVSTEIRRSRQAPNSEQDNAGETVSLLPSLKWLRMLSFRDDVVKEIMELFSKCGFTLTPRCEGVLRKIWFLMDIPDTRRRASTIQNKYLWSDWEIFHAIFIFAQIESLFTGHRTGTPRAGIRRLLMGQKNLLLLRDALKGEALQTHYEMLREYMRWRYRPLPHEANMNLFGVPPGQAGLLQWENYGRTGSRVRIQRPDELILRECARRQLDMMNMYATTYVLSESDPTLKREYRSEPETTFLRETMDQARRNNTNWLQDIRLE